VRSQLPYDARSVVAWSAMAAVGELAMIRLPACVRRCCADVQRAPEVIAVLLLRRLVGLRRVSGDPVNRILHRQALVAGGA